MCAPLVIDWRGRDLGKVGGFWKFFVNCSDRKLSVGQIVNRLKPSLIRDTLEGLKMGSHHSRRSGDPMDSHTG